MKKEDLTDAMNFISDDKIAKAHEPYVAKKHTMPAWAKPAILVAACLLVFFATSFFWDNIIGLFKGPKQGVTPTGSTYSVISKDGVIYASAFSNGDLMYYDNNSKVFFSPVIATQKDDAALRVAIAFHDYWELYPEFCFSYEDEANTWDDWLAFEKKVSSKEAEFLAGIGATDIVPSRRNTILCTIQKKNIEKLNNGQCRYSVALYTQDDQAINNLDINSFNGKYLCRDLVGTPAHSSFRPQQDFISSGNLTLKDGKISISFIYNKDENSILSINIKDAKCTKIENPTNDDFKYDSMTVLMSLKQRVMYSELIYSTPVAYQVDGSNYMLYITNDAIYLDMGLTGLYIFK